MRSMAAPPSGSASAARTLASTRVGHLANREVADQDQHAGDINRQHLARSVASAKKMAVRKSRFGQTLMRYG